MGSLQLARGRLEAIAKTSDQPTGTAGFAITGGYKLFTNDQPRRLTLLLPPRYQRQANSFP